MSENWLERVGDVEQVINDLRSRYDVEKACSGEVYDLAMAMMALAVNQAVNETGLTPRKKQRVVRKMADWLMNGAVAVFMLGYDTAKREQVDA